MMAKGQISKVIIAALCILGLIGLAEAKPARLTNPLLHYVKFRELKPFRDKIEALIKKEKDAGLAKDVSVYFRSLSNGMWFGIDEKCKFSPASLLKVPIMMAYFKAAETDPGILKKKLKYAKSDQMPTQNIKDGQDARIGKYYTVDQIIGMMISKSDNNADAILFNNIDREVLDQVFDYLGVSIRNAGAKDDFVSLKGYASLFRVLYNASFLNEEMSQEALEILTDSIFVDGMVASLPKGVTIAHKFGERIIVDEDIRQLHEIGIIYYPDNTYLLGIMTRGKDFTKQAQVIREISSLVYNEVDVQVKTWRAENYIGED